jgi:hypothetical protein
MELISEALVEETWQEVAGFSPRLAEKEMNRTAKSQRELIGFIAAYTEDLSREAAELAFYMFFTIFRMFQKSAGGGIESISGGQIEQCLDQNESMLERLEGAHEKFVERVAKVEASRQPFVMRYLVETLIEAPDGDDPVFLSEEETGALFLVLKTVIDVLDQPTAVG